jgi:hypothetical protein
VLPFISVAWDSWDLARWNLIFNGYITFCYLNACDHYISGTKETYFTIFGDLLLVTKGFSDFITLWWHFMIEHDEWKRSLLLFRVKLTNKISVSKFEIQSFQVHVLNLIRYLAVPFFVNIPIWNYTFLVCCQNFLNLIKKRVHLSLTCQKGSLHSISQLRSALKRNLPSWCWNIFIGRNVSFAVSFRPN